MGKVKADAHQCLLCAKSGRSTINDGASKTWILEEVGRPNNSYNVLMRKNTMGYGKAFKRV